MAYEFTERQKKWFKDLESGEFKQGTGVLRRNTPQGCEYCCLGVGIKDNDNTNWYAGRFKDPASMPHLLYSGKAEKVDGVILALRGTLTPVEWGLMGLYSGEGSSYNSGVLMGKLRESDPVLYEKMSRYRNLVDGYRLPSCTTMNDTLKMSFKEISEHLQRYAPYYFKNIKL